MPWSALPVAEEVKEQEIVPRQPARKQEAVQPRRQSKRVPQVRRCSGVAEGTTLLGVSGESGRKYPLVASR